MTDYTSTYTEGTGDTIDTTDFSTEFDAIESAVGTKVDKTDPELNGDVSGTAFLDEDDMSSDSATKLASQQSIKAYIDGKPELYAGTISSNGSVWTNKTSNASAFTVARSSAGQYTLTHNLGTTSYTYALSGNSNGGYNTSGTVATNTMTVNNYNSSGVFADNGNIEVIIFKI